jgi:predicted O-linked N-acetylglucosamine transferase (SPINDLY family)
MLPFSVTILSIRRGSMQTMTEHESSPDINRSVSAHRLLRDGVMTLTPPQAMQHAVGAYLQGDWTEAERLCRLVLDAKADNFDALNLCGAIAAQTGRLQEAHEMLSTAASVNPANADAQTNHGNVLRALNKHAEALSSYERAIALQPDNPLAHNNRGVTLVEVGRYEEALESYERAIALKPDYAEAHYNCGNALNNLGRYAEALENYERAIAFNPAHVDIYINRGNALVSLKRHAEALENLDRAIAIQPDYAEAHDSRGNILAKLKRYPEALESYGRAIALKPSYAEARVNRGNLLQSLKCYSAALEDYDSAIACKPDYAEAHNGRAMVLADLKRHTEALSSYDRAIALNPDFAEAYNNRGNTFVECARYAEALESYARALEIKPDFDFLYGNWLQIKLKICDWVDIASHIGRLTEKIENNEKVCMPFPSLALSSAALQRRAAETFVADSFPENPAAGAIAKYPRHEKLRIGYFSHDFREHATSYLIAELFERHDKSKFDVTAFYFGPDTHDAVRARLSAAVDKFIDVRALSDEDVARLARKLEIDIALDLNGFLQDSRTNIFAQRAAPIQAGYLAYPGTMGAKFIDYFIADATLIPESLQQHYTEKIAYLPDSYQVSDTTRRISDETLNREQLGLPQNGFVFCCFNNNYKIMPSTFDRWMRVLNRVEHSVLWLLEDNALAANNLRKEAALRGISADRLIFAPRMPTPGHLARHRMADLFLDTLPCNAHTTANDALLAGLPVLTCTGETFASRVASSLLNAIGLPELITKTPEEYEALAIELATNRSRLEQIKEKLANNRLSTPLFDMRLYTRHIEAAYTAMYERYQANLPPAHIYVQP